MWTPRALWSHWSMDLSIRIMAKEFEIIEMGVEEGVDLGPESKVLYFPMWCYKGDLFNVQCFISRHHH